MSWGEIIRKIEPWLQPFFQQSEDPRKIPLQSSHYGLPETLAVLECLVTGQVTMGARVAEFERQFASRIGRKFSVMVNSGSSANLLIFAALRNFHHRDTGPLRAEDEILVPALSWGTTIWPIAQNGLVPVLIDAGPRTLQMALPALEAAISPKTRAIMVTHILGNSEDMDTVRAVADRNKLTVIEDTCEALGTTWAGRPAGSMSLASSFSLYFSHHMTTMEGGMITTDDAVLADILRCLRDHGMVRHMESRSQIACELPQIDPRFLFHLPGYNLRPMEVQAAFGLCQLPRLDDMNAARRAVAADMRRALASFADHFHMPVATARADPAPFAFPVVLKSLREETRQRFVSQLEAHHIETRPILAGNLAVHPAMKKIPHRIPAPLVHAQAIMEHGLYWGCHPGMNAAHVEHLQTVIAGTL